MNKNALKRRSKYKVHKTVTGKLPDSFGHSRVQGVTRKLTVSETEAQRKLGVFVSLNGKPFYGLE